ALGEGDPQEVRYFLEQKKLLTELGRTSELPAVYDALFRLSPTRADLAYERGQASLTLARNAAPNSTERETTGRAAMSSFERAVLDPTLGLTSLLGLASAARLLGDFARARQAYEEYLAKRGQSENAAILKELGHTFRESGHPAEAEQTYARAIALGLEDNDLLWGEVEVLSELNLEAKALRYLDVLAKREPANLEFLRTKGQLLLKMGRRAEGTHALKAAAEQAKDDPLMQFEVGHALRIGGAYPDAIDAFRRGLTAEPTDRAGRLSLAETLNLAGRYDEAIPVVDGLLNDDPNDLGAWRVRSDACRALGRTSDLEYSLKAILLLDPADSPSLIEKFRLHLAGGEKADALESLTNFLGSEHADARNPSLLLEAADLASELGRADDANQLYERAAELDPAQANPISVRRARLRLTAGRPDLALAILDAIPKVEPAPPDPEFASHLLRADILAALERPSEAADSYREVLERDPHCVPAELGLGRAFLDQGKHAEAKVFLNDIIPKGAPNSGLYLLLAEAESGLGSIPAALAAVQRGVEVLPDSIELWKRLGELAITRENWPEAARAFHEAIARRPDDPDLVLRAGFVAEQQGHPTEALALYERATQIGPSNKYAWSSRGVALLAHGRPEEATQSFDRALALDSDFDAARQGRKAALERTREAQVDRWGREALLLENRLHRTVTKNDLFVTLHTPFDLLEPVLSTLSKVPRIDLANLSEEEFKNLETESCQLVTAALDRRADNVERRGFSLPDVATLGPASRSLAEIQRLFGYLQAVLEVDIRPENLQLTPDVEELARRALLMPAEQRTLFQLVRTLRVGVFRARLIKAVESTGTAVHAPLPSLDFGQYSPEFRPGAAVPSPMPEGPGPAARAPDAPTQHKASGEASGTAAAPRPMPSQARCVGCGGLASIIHTCGAPVCAHCIVEFRTCPKCRQPASLPIPEPPGAPSPTAHAALPAPHHAAAPARGPLHALRQAVAFSKSGGRGAPRTRPRAEEKPEKDEDEPAAHSEEAAKSTAAPGPARPPHPTRPREKADDEPRL
ncbi:MAG: tetratricopeptide repeat protein, partial [Thermoplasmata archaeon]|nr:tetratricopeptide repeat protein [Thermoplasmata archaeon]